jgi:hypothetical protein
MEQVMADIPLFDLTADGKYRLAYDRLQWILQRRKAAPRNDDTGYRGIWFVGRKKHTLLEGFARSGVELTPTAQRRFNALPDTFDEFYAQIREPRPDISGVRPPVEGGRYFDHASPGPLPPPNGEIALGTVTAP